MKKVIPILVILIGCQAKTEPMETAKPIEKASMPVSLLDEVPPSTPNDRQWLAVQGMVQVPPNREVSIQPHFEGFVKDIRVLEGSRVQKGDILFKLENPDFIALQEDYLMDKATVDYLEKELKRSKTLHGQEITTDREMQEVEMNYQIAKANLNAVTRTLNLMNLPLEEIQSGRLFSFINCYAPISGQIDRLWVTSGEFIQRGKAVVNLVNIDDLHLELRVFEKDAVLIKKGQLIQFRVPEVNDQLYQAEIHLVGPSVDEQTRMVIVHAHVEEEATLLPGMFVEAEIKLD